MKNIVCMVLFACVSFTVQGRVSMTVGGEQPAGLAEQPRGAMERPTEDGFVFRGEITGYGDGQLIISYSNPNERVPPDTIPIKDDRFEFHGSLESPLFVFNKIMDNGKLEQDFFRFDFMLDNSVIDFRADVNNLRDYTLTGSSAHDMLTALRTGAGELLRNFLEAEKAHRGTAAASADKAQVTVEMEKYKNAYLDYLFDFDGFFNSYAGTYALQLFSGRRIPWQRLEEILVRFDPSVHNSPYFIYMQRQVDANRSIQPGQRAADFSVKDLEGNSYSLEDFREHYLLMAFSASWCVPCRYEYPFLLKAYEQYSDRGLKMIIMNLDDTREKWAGDVAKYDFPFPVLSNLEAFTGDLTENYGVMSIPKVFLIDPEGRIVSGTIRQQQILDTLGEVLEE